MHARIDARVHVAMHGSNKLEDADMAQNLQVGPKLGNIKKVLFLLFILLFILLY